jgi:hypothetical protein
MVVLVLLARPEGLGSFLRRPARASSAIAPSDEAAAVTVGRLSGRAVNSRLRRAAVATNGHRPVPALVLDEGGTR